jgi:hypothetical protein
MHSKNYTCNLSQSLFTVTLLLTTIFCPPSFAEDAPEGSKPSSEAAATSSQSTPLQAGVKLIEVNLDHLRDLGLDLKHVMAGASHLYDEVNITPVSLQTVPEVVGRGIIINIPIGTMPSGLPAPPRKARLDLAMAQMVPIVTLLKADVDAFLSGQQRLDIAEDTRSELKPTFQNWAASVTAMSEQLDKLKKLTAGPTFDNGAISAGAQQVQSNCKDLQKDLKKVYKTLQKEAKRNKRA